MMAMRMTTIMIGTAYRGPVVFIYPGPRRMSLPMQGPVVCLYPGPRRISLLMQGPVVCLYPKSVSTKWWIYKGKINSPQDFLL